MTSKANRILFKVAPLRERGLKLQTQQYPIYHNLVAPLRERGLKLSKQMHIRYDLHRRSFAGAWIEIAECHIVDSA